MSNTDLVSAYHEFFQLIPANTRELREEVYRIRHEVYCEDLGWEDPSAHPNGMETDKYDRISSHCLLLHKPSNRFAGCVRLVRANPETSRPSIPLAEHCKAALDSSILDIDSLPRPSFGEISRLAIRAEFRRRPGEKENPAATGTPPPPRQGFQRRRFPHIALGLYLGAASIGLGEGLEGVFAMMEPRLARRLRLAGIHFRQVGKVMDYHGPRAPFYIDRTGLLENLRPDLMRLLEAVGEDLGLCHSLDDRHPSSCPE